MLYIEPPLTYRLAISPDCELPFQRAPKPDESAAAFALLPDTLRPELLQNENPPKQLGCSLILCYLVPKQ